jgi:hypothetical protein
MWPVTWWVVLRKGKVEGSTETGEKWIVQTELLGKKKPVRVAVLPDAVQGPPAPTADVPDSDDDSDYSPDQDGGDYYWWRWHRRHHGAMLRVEPRKKK